MSKTDIGKRTVSTSLAHGAGKGLIWVAFGMPLEKQTRLEHESGKVVALAVCGGARSQIGGESGREVELVDPREVVV